MKVKIGNLYCEHVNIHMMIIGFIDTNQDGCTSLYVEWAIQPNEILENTAGNFPCSSTDQLPDPNLFLSLSEEEYVYNKKEDKTNKHWK